MAIPEREKLGLKRLDISFISKGKKCAAWLYLPDHFPNPPVVIMAHGIGAEKTFGLPAFAEKFAARGLASFLFDYRYFGASQGEPRHLLNPRRQIEDWLSAITYVKSLKTVDTQKIALWGTSYSGGHVLVAASRAEGISAVVSQVPFVDQIDFILQKSIKYLSQFLLFALRDIIGWIIFKKRFYVPVVGKPDSFAILNTPECYNGYMGLLPEGSTWENKITPAGLLWLYRPVQIAQKITCPVLLVCGERDSVVLQRTIPRTAKRIKNCELVIRPVNHFEFYKGEPFQEIVQIEGDFLTRMLLHQ